VRLMRSRWWSGLTNRAFVFVDDELGFDAEGFSARAGLVWLRCG
jgi:hypothetical protein